MIFFSDFKNLRVFLQIWYRRRKYVNITFFLYFADRASQHIYLNINPLAPEFFFSISAHPVYKM